MTINGKIEITMKVNIISNQNDNSNKSEINIRMEWKWKLKRNGTRNKSTNRIK